MFRVDRGSVLKGETLTHVDHPVDARELPIVDVDPTRDGLLAAADVQPNPGRRRLGLGGSAKEFHHVAGVSHSASDRSRRCNANPVLASRATEGLFMMRLPLLLLVLVSCLLTPLFLRAQTTGSVVGRVTDDQGSGLPGVTV